MDYSFFTKKQRSNIVIILVYVDDMLVTGNNLAQILATKGDLQEAFKVKDLGELKYFLGIEFCRSQQRILMNQRKYSLELISDVGLSASKTVNTPLDNNQKFTSKESNDVAGENTDELFEDREQYQRLICKLLYLTLTRLDIAFAVQTLSQFMQYPKRSHWEASLRIVRYIKREPGMGVLMSSKKSNKITTYCDADWASCSNTRKSVTGFIVKNGDSLIS